MCKLNLFVREFDRYLQGRTPRHRQIPTLSRSSTDCSLVPMPSGTRRPTNDLRIGLGLVSK